MRQLRIVFMGTPDFAVAILEQLLEHKFDVVGVITAPDRPAGRGRKMTMSAVKKYAIAQKLTILQPTNLKSELFLEELHALDANLQVVVAFRMLPKAVWKLPAYGTFNLHASLLPEYRGAAPINWAIINGEKETGVTTFFIDEKIDTGEIIMQRSLRIGETETAGELHDRLMILGGHVVVDTVKLLEKGKVKTRKQPKKEEKAAPKLFKENCKIDWQASRKKIYNKIRGLSPYPAAWTTLLNGTEEIELKLLRVRHQKEDHTLAIGTVVASKKMMKIAVRKGYIIVDELQLSGKRKMKIQDLLNGFTFLPNATVL